MKIVRTDGSVPSLLARVRRGSLDELRVRSVQALHVGMERFWDRLLPATPPAHGGLGAPRIFDRGIECLAGTARGAGDARAIAHAVARLDPELAARFAAQSDAAERGLVALLGHGPLPVGNPPRWHREPVSGIEAPRRHWSRIDHLDANVVGDHKVLWELNRHQYLLAPAFCWLLEGQARRFALIESHLESWLEDNPPRHGVNWVSSLELALRAITWCWLLWMLRAAPWRTELRRALALSLEAHARHIERYLSSYFSPNTHLTGEALGLFYVGTVLHDCPRASRWRDKGAAILEAEIARQLHADGIYFEQATQYQRYTAEIYLHYLLLAAATGARVSAKVRERLASSLAVLRALSSGAGRIPLLGDDDGGMLLPLDHRPPDDVRALLLAGAAALERPELRAGDWAPPGYAYWLRGIERSERVRARVPVHPAFCDMYFAHGGLAILRDGWERDAAVAVIDAGPHGALSCGHSHADALAMTLSLGTTELFIDRGTLTYIGRERNEFRATGSHNTLEIDGTSAVTPGAPFKWLPPIPPRAHGLVCSSVPFSAFIGSARGHELGGRPSGHCRRVLHRRGGAWVIHDRGVRAGARSGVLRWQLAPLLTLTPLTARSVAVHAAGEAVAVIYMRGMGTLRILTREVSPRLGQRTAASCLELDTGNALEAVTIVVPALPDRSLPTFQEGALVEEGIAWSDDSGRHRLFCGAPSRITSCLASCVASCTTSLPPTLQGAADLVWWLEAAKAGGDETGLVAAFHRSTSVAGDGHSVMEESAQSGTMSVWENIAGAWRSLSIELPRRG